MAYVIIYLVAAFIGLAITFIVIRAAVRAALMDHYKTVRWFELTGEWRVQSTSKRIAPLDVALAGTEDKFGTPH